MTQREYDNHRLLCNNICDALADAYQDETPVEYQFAVNPKTYEVKVVESLAGVPAGWIYESIVDAEWSTICDCADQYFDFRS